jgi:hypothetical protein
MDGEEQGTLLLPRRLLRMLPRLHLLKLFLLLLVLVLLLRL